VRSLAHVLGQTVGRTFQAGCDAALGDARCKIDLENTVYKGAGVITELLRDRAFLALGLSAFEAGWFTSGTITWTTGANAGRITEVLAHDLADSVTTLTLLEAPVRPISEGDSFIARAGCDKRIATCGAKFANTANFRGFPNIPGQDAVVRYASQDGGHQGNCCDDRRSRPRCRHSAVMAGHALSRSGESARGRCDCLGWHAASGARL